MEPEKYQNTDLRIRAVGRDQVQQLLRMLRSAFPDATFSVEQSVEGERGTISYVLAGAGTHTGDIEGRPATGTKANIVVVASPIERGSGKQ
nr:ester cyclase [uncultured bacterium]AXL05625.1 ester cyclase [uncultured bacterium]